MQAFENSLTNLLAQPMDSLLAERKKLDKTWEDLRLRFFHNEKSYRTYARIPFAERYSVQLQLARSEETYQKFPFFNFLLDDDKWMRKLNALQYLAEAMRFIALARTVFQCEITKEEAYSTSIEEGLKKITNAVKRKTVVLDRRRRVASEEDVTNLFNGFKKLWDAFSCGMKRIPVNLSCNISNFKMLPTTSNPKRFSIRTLNLCSFLPVEH